MKNSKITRMAGMGLLMALVVVMQFLGASIPPMGGFTISLVLIPIVLGGAIFGPGAGALLGAVFGVIVFANCVSGADPGGAMVLQADPFLCFLVVMAKGILAGWLSALVYHAVKRKNSYVAMLLSAVVCPLINTGIFILCMALFFMDVLTAWANGLPLVGYILTGLVIANFIPELVINCVFSPAGNRIVQIIKK